MKKFILSTFLVIVPLIANAQYFINGVCYNIDYGEDHEAYVTNKKSFSNDGNYVYSGDVSIDGSISIEHENWKGEKYTETYRITWIDYGVFKNNKELTSVHMPSSITKISPQTFRNCTGLTAITLPSGLKSVGVGAFDGCNNITTLTLNAINYDIDIAIPYNWSDYGSIFPPKLKHINFGPGVKNIPAHLYRAQDFKEVVLPTSIEGIGESAFANSTLEKIVLPAGVKRICSHAFNNCENLVEINLPDGLTEIEYRLFAGCTKLKEIKLPQNVVTVEDDSFLRTAVTQMDFPDKVTYIGRFCLYGCPELTTITIGKGIKKIGISAFQECPKLKSVTCFASTPPEVGWNSYDEYVCYPNGKTLYVPEESIETYKNSLFAEFFDSIKPITSVSEVDDLESDEVIVDIYKLDGTHIYHGPQDKLNQKCESPVILKSKNGKTKKAICAY